MDRHTFEEFKNLEEYLSKDGVLVIDPDTPVNNVNVRRRSIRLELDYDRMYIGDKRLEFKVKEINTESGYIDIDIVEEDF